LLSVSQGDDEPFGAAVFGDQEQAWRDDEALFFEDMPGPDHEAEMPTEDLEFSFHAGIYGPLTYEEHCRLYEIAPDFLGPFDSPTNTTSSTSGGAEYVRTFIVDTLPDTVNANDGVPSLREAITSANATTGKSSITFADTPSGTITLNGTALPTLTKSVDMIGPGADVLTIGGNDRSRIFNATATATTITLEGLTLTNGYVSTVTGGGASAFAYGTLTLRHLSVKDSQTAGSGGGVYVSQSDALVTEDCRIAGNRTGEFGYGGGLHVRDTEQVDIRDSIFEGNEAKYGGGIAPMSDGRNTMEHVVITGNNTEETYLSKTNDVTITNSRILDNTADAHGGGAVIYYSENVTIEGSEISGGVYLYSTGDTLIRDRVIANNSATTYGGGIATTRTSTGVFADLPNNVTVRDSVMRNNTAGTYGGGLYVTDTASVMTVQGTTLQGNIGGKGGGIDADSAPTPNIDNTTITGNKADLGGGYYQNAGTSQIAAHFRDNVAASSGGGICLTDTASVMTVQGTRHCRATSAAKAAELTPIRPRRRT
jgi:CSLREA domain-containing protein